MPSGGKVQRLVDPGQSHQFRLDKEVILGMMPMGFGRTPAPRRVLRPDTVLGGFTNGIALEVLIESLGPQ